MYLQTFICESAVSPIYGCIIAYALLMHRNNLKIFLDVYALDDKTMWTTVKECVLYEKKTL